MNKKGLRDINVQNKKVLVRCDFNVPFDGNMNITDDIRITSALPTINYLLDNGAAVILMSHLGRPDGEPNHKYSLLPVAKRLEELTKRAVIFEDCDIVVDDKVRSDAAKLQAGQIMLLQNTRYIKEETKNGEEFAKNLASLADIFVNDAFGAAHRAHSSTAGVCKFIPSAVGFLIEKEIEVMGKALSNPERPLTAILGGSKVSDKISVIENLLNIADNVIIGGGMVYTFLKANGKNIGKSLLEEDKIELAKALIEKAKEKNVKLYLPIDIVVAKEFKNDTDFYTVSIDNIPDDYMGLDIGQKSTEMFIDVIKNSRTVIWNGPVGVFEMDNFAKGTNSIAYAISESPNLISIIGGGDSAAAVEKIGLADKITHISTGGGASLEFLEGKILPGIDAVDDKRTPLIAGNWKMNNTIDEGLSLTKSLIEFSNNFDKNREILICAPFTALHSLKIALKGSKIKLGAQNMHCEESGAYTGEVSPLMLKDIGVDYVLIGHSERRQYFNENDEFLNKKIKSALKHAIKPILCVGETLAQREANIEKETVKTQIINGFKDIEADSFKYIAVAYEPVWAIGTGKTATSEQAQEMISHIRNVIRELYNEEISESVRIQYGGSVKASNTSEIMSKPDIDGALVGGASLKAEEFIGIINY